MEEEAKIDEEFKINEEFKRGNISLILNSYNDIFSSFDARPFAEKSLSIDFLEECKRAARDKEEFGLELILSVPKFRRNLNEEFKIKKRIKDHFHRHSLEKDREISKIKREGYSWIISGIILIVLVAYGLLTLENQTIRSLLAILEVPSWFLIWEGLGKILLDARKIEPDFAFYKKMSNANITFRSY